jgi:hypothetical protein
VLWRLLPEVVHAANTLGAHFSYLFNLKAAAGIDFFVRSIYNLLNDCRRFLTCVADPDPYVLGPPGSASGSVCHKYVSGSGTFHHQAKNSKKNLDFYGFVTSLWLFIFEKWWKCSSVGLGLPDPYPDPLVRGTDPRIRIRNTASNKRKHTNYFSVNRWSTGLYRVGENSNKETAHCWRKAAIGLGRTVVIYLTT